MKVVKADRGKNISAIVKSDEAETFADRQRDAKLGVQNEQFVSTCWHLDQ